MPKKIVEVLSITSASQWWLAGRDGSSDEPLACWAMVLVYDDQYPSLNADKEIVGVTGNELDSVSSIELDSRMYFHDSER
ncbi:hypothetical protein [Tardiphaga sp.]|jgi:hypothetical protein|uniref:hypothetical protein n=1 Tax=Tardiphaga sp. TaxID=1926292 RepID=UPI0037D9FE38